MNNLYAKSFSSCLVATLLWVGEPTIPLGAMETSSMGGEVIKSALVGSLLEGLERCEIQIKFGAGA